MRYSLEGLPASGVNNERDESVQRDVSLSVEPSQVLNWLRAEQQRGWWQMSEKDYGMLVAAAARCG